MERQIFCRVERAAFEAIYEITTRYGAHVFPHLRIREVANRDWINETDFDFALKGHIDFTVTQDYKPVLALELDGHYHQSARAKERDKKKDAVCDSLNIPLVRIDYGDMRPDIFRPILKDLIDSWLDKRQSDRPVQHVLQFPGSSAPPASLEVCTSDLAFGYSEAVVKLMLNGEKIQMGSGRVKMPPGSPVCGRLIAERIAITHAAQYLRAVERATKQSTFEPNSSPLLIDCPNCAGLQPLPPATGFVNAFLDKAQGLPSALS